MSSNKHNGILKQCLQHLRHEKPIPDMRPWAVPQIMTKTGNLYALHISIRNVELWLALLKMRRHGTGKIRNAYIIQISQMQ